jgi:tetratricopeptide (TPR) repeat protein
MARDAVDRMFTRAAQDLVEVPHMEQVRRALLEDALEFYQGFLKERSTDPTVTHETARASMQVGIIYHELGRSDQVEKPLRQAITLLEGLSEKLPAVAEIRQDLARCYGELAFRHFWALRTREAIQGRRKALAVREKLAADFPTVPAYARDLARAHSALATSLTGGEVHFEEAEEHHRKALAIWQKCDADFPDLPKDRVGEAHLRHWWGALLFLTGRFQEAEAEYRTVLALREQLVAEGPATPKLMGDLEHIRSYLGGLLFLTGRPDQAEPFWREGIKIRERLRDDFPHIPDHRRRLGGNYFDLHEALLAMGRIQEAEAVIRRGLAIFQELVDQYPGAQPYPERLAYGYDRLGRFLHGVGRAEEAAGAFRRSLEISEKLLVECPDQLPVLIPLAEVLIFCPAPHLRDEARAVALLRRALQRSPTVGRCWLAFGAALYRTGAWEGAIEALNKSVKSGHLTPSDAPISQFFLAMAHWRLGRKDLARTFCDRAVASMDNRKPKYEVSLLVRAEAAALLGEPELPAEVFARP